MQQSRVVTPWLRPLCQKGHSTFPPPLWFTAFPLHQDPLPLSTPTSGTLRSSVWCKKKDFFFSLTLIFFSFFFQTFFPAIYQMMISFYYGGKLMHSTVVNQCEGCRISPQHHLGRGTLYSSASMQSVHFPPAELIEYERQRHFTRKLLGHMDRGVLVRANQEGIFIKRLCQSRVFWMGLAEVGPQCSPMPCKLERDAVVKIFDMEQFLQGAFVRSVSNATFSTTTTTTFLLCAPALQLYQEGQVPAPDPIVTLCFGEELHEISSAKNKLIIVQVRPVRRTADPRGRIKSWKPPLLPSSTSADQHAELPALAGVGERAALAALLQQPNHGHVR